MYRIHELGSEGNPERSPNGAAVPVLPVAVLLGMTAVLTMMGRPLWCACAGWEPWVGDIWSRHNSQHLLDPYSVTHFQHGLVFYALLWLALRHKTDVRQRFVLALALEAAWEILENSPLIIQRYRQATISLDYLGDSLGNSLGDLLACAAGYGVAAVLPVAGTVGVFLLCEVGMLLAYRDSLLLNVLMLVAPSESIRRWQAP